MTTEYPEGDNEARGALFLRNLGNPDLVKHILRFFARITLNRPPELSIDQQLVFMLLWRFGLNAGTLWELFFPTARVEMYEGITDRPLPIRDVPAISVIVRALYEVFLFSYYLLDESIDSEERQCRILAWRYNALITTRELVGRIEPSFFMPTKHVRESETLLQQLNENRNFKDLDKNRQDHLLKYGKSRNIQQQANDAGIPDRLHRFLYKQLSSFSHCDYHGYSQLNQVSIESNVDSVRSFFLLIASMMLDLTQCHILRDEIHDDKDLCTLMRSSRYFIAHFESKGV